ncbi:ABC transporter permease [Cohnella soli]|uniref:ABC transporter permease n=1 Tax=Cohnella soli TaxID=425005 RepID=A0ABW0HTV6_9BACL
MSNGSYMRELIKNKVLYLMTLPGLLLILLFSYLPMGGLIIAFKDYRFDKGVFGSAWSGLQNFEFFFSSQDALRVTFNTLYMNALFIVTGTVMSILCALLVIELKNKIGKKIIQTTLLLPYFISWVVVGYFVFALLNNQIGVVNQLLTRIGVGSIDWYSSPHYWPVILVLVSIWKNTGYSAIIYLAAIIGINEEYYEAARIDGANRFQEVMKITLPLIAPIISILTLIAIGKIFYADFGLFYNVPRNIGVLYSTTDVIDTYVFRALRNTGDIGMSSAVAFYQSTVGFVLVLFSNYIVRKINPENSLF